jgi:hypothetical protein
MIADKSLIETTRCIGYAYYKEEEIIESGSFEIPLWERVHLRQPNVYSSPRDSDRFIIFGLSC